MSKISIFIFLSLITTSAFAVTGSYDVTECKGEGMVFKYGVSAFGPSFPEINGQPAYRVKKTSKGEEYRLDPKSPEKGQIFIPSNQNSFKTVISFGKKTHKVSCERRIEIVAFNPKTGLPFDQRIDDSKRDLTKPAAERPADSEAINRKAIQK